MEARSATFVLMQYRLFFARIACKSKQQGARDNETAIARSTRDPINRVPHAHAAPISSDRNEQQIAIPTVRLFLFAAPVLYLITNYQSLIAHPLDHPWKILVTPLFHPSLLATSLDHRLKFSSNQLT